MYSPLPGSSVARKDGVSNIYLTRLHWFFFNLTVDMIIMEYLQDSECEISPYILLSNLENQYLQN